MNILEWSDTRVSFKIREIVNDVSTDLDLDSFDEYKLEIQFADDSLLEIDWQIDDNEDKVNFDILWEYTDWKEWSIKADIRGLKWLKKVRFNQTSIKWKVLDSVYVPNVIVQDN
jgi:hypothetical protein